MNPLVLKSNSLGLLANMALSRIWLLDNEFKCIFFNIGRNPSFKIIADVEELQQNDGTTPYNKSICFQMG